MKNDQGERFGAWRKKRALGETAITVTEARETSS